MEYMSIFAPIDTIVIGNGNYESDEEFFKGYEEIFDENSEYSKWLKENCPF